MKSSPRRHIKEKRIDFAQCNKSIMAIKLLSTNLEQFLRRIKSQIGRNCHQTPKILLKISTGKISFQI